MLLIMRDIKIFIILFIKNLLELVCAVGYLGSQKQAEMNFKEVVLITNTNYLGCVSILNIIANDFEKKEGLL